MRRISFLWTAIALLVLSSLVCADDRRTDKSVLVVMTLNAEFLWDGVEPEEGQVNFAWKGSQTEAEEHMQKVAELIIQSNPDLINLVEVENIEALTTFNDKFLAGRGYRPYLVKGNDTYTGQDVALLTRIDPEGGTIERDDREGVRGTVRKSVSKNYFARILTGDTRILVMGLHFLAQPNREDRRLQREAQAEAIRSIAQEKSTGGFHALILGDFNDYDGEQGSRDHIDSMPISSVLSIVRSMDSNNSSDDLVNAASLAPKAIRFTAFFDANDNGEINPPQEFTSIDHVLLSPELASLVELVEIPHNHDPRAVTDHFPVVVRFRLAPTPEPAPTSTVRITRLLPNPPGDDSQNEEATLKNIGGVAVSLVGWKLRDLAGQTWALDELGTLQPGQEKTIRRQGQAMALNNNGDSVNLVDPTGKTIQTVTYPSVVEGETVTTSSL